MDSRLELLQQWCCEVLPSVRQETNALSITSVAGDASFRRYFRVSHPALDAPLIAMDAPPEKEDTEPFLRIAKGWVDNGIPVPKIIAENDKLGFLLLDDFGDQQMLSRVASLEDEPKRLWYQKALDELHKIQNLSITTDLPQYDAALLQRELDLFTDWLLDKALKLELSDSEMQIIDDSKKLLIQSALQQPKVVVHRDYHSRNIMILPNDALGIIDFQDAVIGPVTYDLVSLLRDCYIRLEPALVKDLAHRFFQDSNVTKATGVSEAVFWHDFELMGIQRHMKASGIFARLALRDSKWSYIQDIPLTLRYIIQACEKHAELSDFGKLVELKILPAAVQFAKEQGN